MLYKDLDGTAYEVELPLTSHINPEDLRKELEIPDYVDMKYFPMKSAIVTLWAAVNAPRLHEIFPKVFEKRISKKPITALLFGGGAVKIHCKSANSDSSLARDIKDTDYIVPKKQGVEFYRLLLSMDRAFGTCYKSFATANDRRFNAWRHGERYRVTTINGVNYDGTPTITVLDIFCDKIQLRHKVEVKEEFERYRENLYTIGLEALILSKAQFIFDAPKEVAKALKEHNQDYRILNYPYYDKDKIIIGMEEKDVKDVCAIFLDHDLGEGAEAINPEKMQKTLKKDKRLALTVTLNLRNIIEKTHVIERWLSKRDTAKVVDRIEALLQELPVIDKKWNKPWWDTAVETPQI
ncbi:hypothetical protein H5T51_06835 [Candidatus Bathyarchaeota archaeon]|nr:hypothetical protein [Candidatus Bathyarchaeota archaeon]